MLMAAKISIRERSDCFATVKLVLQVTLDFLATADCLGYVLKRYFSATGNPSLEGIEISCICH